MAVRSSRVMVVGSMGKVMVKEVCRGEVRLRRRLSTIEPSGWTRSWLKLCDDVV